MKLEPFTIFVSANGSGKTSILQAIDLLCRTFRGHVGQNEADIESNRSFGSHEIVERSCESEKSQFLCRVISTTEKTRRLEAQLPVLSGGAFTSVGSQTDWKPWRSQLGMLPNPMWLRLDPNVLRSAQPGADIRTMGFNGQGMHRALASMMLERRDDFSKLEVDLTRIVPSVRQLQPTAEHEIRFNMINGKGLKARQVSEGTLLTLGLLPAIHAENKPGVLLLDDPDRGLHPKAPSGVDRFVARRAGDEFGDSDRWFDSFAVSAR